MAKGQLRSNKEVKKPKKDKKAAAAPLKFDKVMSDKTTAAKKS